MTLLLLLGLLAQGPMLAPVSDEARDQSFSAYVSRLKSAVAKRDVKALRNLVAPDVISGGFGAKDQLGWETFRKLWDLDRRDAPVWDTLADLIGLGFFREGPAIFVTPYVAWKFPKDLDPSQYLVVLRDPLPLRKEPNRDSPVVGKLAFDIVKRVDPQAALGAFDWVQVETSTGTRGFVQAAQVRSPLMPRAQFSNQDGRWRLMVLDRGR